MKSDFQLQFLQEVNQSALPPPKQTVRFIDCEKLICVGGKKGKIYCMEPQCRQHAICCVDDECQCSKNHEQCIKMTKISVYNKKLESQITGSKLAEVIDTTVNEMQDVISNMSELIKKTVKEMEMSQCDKQLREKVQSDYEKIKNRESGNDSSDMGFCGKAIKLHEEKREQCSKYEKELLGKTLVKILQGAQKQVVSRFQSIISTVQKTLTCRPQQNMDFSRSKILSTPQEIERMNSMLKEVQPLSSITPQLIYRGSVDGMSMQEFHSKCDNKDNLLYLVQNEYGKKYGGYCPCPISYNRLEYWETDQTYSSFIFSLNLNQKAMVVQEEYAIRNGHKSQEVQSLVAFGIDNPCSLVIGANSIAKEEYNWILFYGDGSDGSYQTMHSPPSVFVLNGTPEAKCRLKEFQVYEIQFGGVKVKEQY